MDCTRRDLLKGMFNPTFWTGSESEPAPEQSLPQFDKGQDILLQQDLCIAWGKGVCDRCESVCPDDAIIFVGMLHPRIIDSRCTLCGDCVPVCPTKAIAIRPEAASTSEPGEAS